MECYKGDIVFTAEKDSFAVLKNGYIFVQDGIVKDVYSIFPAEYNGIYISDYSNKLIIPSFCDLHTHAPQFANMGLGLDMELLQWLETYTFPEEAKYADTQYARKRYQFVADALIRVGTTRAVLFATIHKEATELLMSILEEAGICCYVGKVNMDRGCPEYIRETTADSISNTIEWIERTKDKYQNVRPIITPRFVPACSSKLMEEMARLSRKFDLPIQSHLDENKGEIELVSCLHPAERSYAHVYYSHGLLGHRTLMAHCIHMDDSEIGLLKETKTITVHCPFSNMNLASGIMPVTQLLDMGVKIGLGSDVSAGHTPSIRAAMVAAINASKLLYERTGQEILTESQAFYLATKSSGTIFGKVGSFERGYEFDALIIDDGHLSANEDLDLYQRIHRYIYTGDDRNIIKRFCKGKEL